MLRALFKLVFNVLLVSAIGVVTLGFLALQDQPVVEQTAAPTPQDVVTTRTFVREARSVVNAGSDAPPPLVVSEAELNSVIRLGARLIPGFRGKLVVRPDDVLGEISIPVPWISDTKWLNLSVTAPEFSQTFSLSSVKVGRFDVSPGLALELGRIGADVLIGNDFGTTIVTAASGMRITGDQLTFRLDIKEVGQNGVIRGVFGSLRGGAMPAPEQIDRYYVMIREAMDRGELPARGSFLPYLKFTLQVALDGSRIESPENAYTSALFALTRVCGARNFTFVVGGTGNSQLDDSRDWATDCAQLTMNGRIDSRRHFITAAALQAASNRGFAVSVGEFKELIDTVEAAGFDFTDLAANNSGIRMSDRIMSAPIDDWPGLLARIQSESDVIVPFQDVPGIMSAQEFETRFGSVESPEYYAVLNSIEVIIDGLALHAPG